MTGTPEIGQERLRHDDVGHVRLERPRQALGQDLGAAKLARHAPAGASCPGAGREVRARPSCRSRSRRARNPPSPNHSSACPSGRHRAGWRARRPAGGGRRRGRGTPASTSSRRKAVRPASPAAAPCGGSSVSLQVAQVRAIRRGSSTISVAGALTGAGSAPHRRTTSVFAVSRTSRRSGCGARKRKST